MNDLDYAKMIEIPVNTADVTVKKTRRFRRKRHENLKKELIETLNEEPVNYISENPPEEDAAVALKETDEQPDGFIESVQITTVKSEKKRRGKRPVKFTFDVVAAQVAVIAVLVLTIMLTNIFWHDSGINTLVRSVFAADEKTEADKAYSEFSPTLPSTAKVSLSEGVMTFSGGGSVYSPCDGTVVKVAKNADKTDITIKYSPSFTAVISGAEFAYYGEGDSIFKSIPVCYSSGDVKVYLYNSGKLLTNYTLDNGKIIWQS